MQFVVLSPDTVKDGCVSLAALSCQGFCCIDSINMFVFLTHRQRYGIYATFVTCRDRVKLHPVTQCPCCGIDILCVYIECSIML